MNPPKSATAKSLPAPPGSVGVSVGALPSTSGDAGALSHEQAIAGAVLTFGAQAVREAQLAGITTSSFTDRHCRAAWTYAMAQTEAGNPVLPVDLAMAHKVPPDAVEAILAGACAIPEHVGYHADKLLGERQRSSLRENLQRHVERLTDAAMDAALIAAEITLAVEGFAPKSSISILDAGAYISSDPPAHDPIVDGLFEAGDKVGIIASAKRKKTWFALQLAMCVATGRPFIGWTIPKARRVLVVQPEIKPDHYHRRVRFMAQAMGIHPDDLNGRLGVVNARGLAIDADQIQALSSQWKAELVIVDPLYKLSEGDENKAQDIKPLLAAFDRIAVKTGAAVCWVHHDAKGAPGDRDARDRGAGSNILIRDVDQLFTLTPHRDDPDATVVETLARNYADELPRTIAWIDGCFTESSLTAIPKTSANVSRYADALRKIDEDEPGLSCSAAAERLGCDRSRVSRLRRQRGVA